VHEKLWLASCRMETLHLLVERLYYVQRHRVNTQTTMLTGTVTVLCKHA